MSSRVSPPTPSKERPVTAPSASANSSSSGGGEETRENAASSEKGANVQVVVRCRPPNENEKKANDAVIVGVNSKDSEVHVLLNKNKAVLSNAGNNVFQAKDIPKKTYTFDQTYGQFSTQEEVYNAAVKPLVDEVLNGYNCTVFAYGQTGTGKTHTMEGKLEINDPNAGVIPRCVKTIFEELESKNLESSVKVSFLELYNEELSDLLATETDNSGPDAEEKQLRIFEDSTGKKGMFVINLEEVLVTSASQVFALLKKGCSKRQKAETLMNKNSSRSHCVFTITIHTKEYSSDGEDIIKTGKLYLVDLAGSECVGKSGAQNQRAKEAGKINQSLLTLGRVINALVERQAYIPYRDSKLTRLLQESLGGRAKTVVIATVSPSAAAFDETLSTLEYANRAKNIRNKPQVNQQMSKRSYMKELLAEIAALKRENEVLRTKNGIILPPEVYESILQEKQGKSIQLEEYMQQLKTKDSELEKLTEVLTEKEALIKQQFEEKSNLTHELLGTKAALADTVRVLTETQQSLALYRVRVGNLRLQMQQVKASLKENQLLVALSADVEGELTELATDVTLKAEKLYGEKNQLHDKVDALRQYLQTNETHVRAALDKQEATAQLAQTHLHSLTASVDASTAEQQTAAQLAAAQAQEQQTQLSTALRALQMQRQTAYAEQLQSLTHVLVEQLPAQQQQQQVRRAEQQQQLLAALNGQFEQQQAAWTTVATTTQTQQTLVQQQLVDAPLREQQEWLQRLESHLDVQEDKLAATQARTASFAADAATQLSAMTERVQAYQASAQQQLAAWTQNLLNSVTTLLHDYQQTTTQHMQTFTAALHAQLDAQAERHCNETQTLRQTVEQLQAENRRFRHHMQTAAQVHATALQQAQTMQMTTTTQLQQLHTQLQTSERAQADLARQTLDELLQAETQHDAHVQTQLVDVQQRAQQTQASLLALETQAADSVDAHVAAVDAHWAAAGEAARAAQLTQQRGVQAAAAEVSLQWHVAVGQLKTCVDAQWVDEARAHVDADQTTPARYTLQFVQPPAFPRLLAADAPLADEAVQAFRALHPRNVVHLPETQRLTANALELHQRDCEEGGEGEWVGEALVLVPEDYTVTHSQPVDEPAAFSADLKNHIRAKLAGASAATTSPLAAPAGQRDSPSPSAALTRPLSSSSSGGAVPVVAMTLPPVQSVSPKAATAATAATTAAAAPAIPSPVFRPANLQVDIPSSTSNSASTSPSSAAVAVEGDELDKENEPASQTPSAPLEDCTPSEKAPSATATTSVAQLPPAAAGGHRRQASGSNSNSNSSAIPISTVALGTLKEKRGSVNAASATTTTTTTATTSKTAAAAPTPTNAASATASAAAVAPSSSSSAITPTARGSVINSTMLKPGARLRFGQLPAQSYSSNSNAQE